MLHDTIAAVSTPYGKGGIAVIRISGENTAAVLQGCFTTSGPNPVDNPRRACFGTVMQNGETIDSGIAVYFAPGASFTGEASAEISCHGGTAVTAAVLEAVFRAGAQPAGPGEFTRRAFLNGKLSLTQAQAVGLLIDADTDSRRRLAASALQGALREKTQGMRAQLTSLLASLYADYRRTVRRIFRGYRRTADTACYLSHRKCRSRWCTYRNLRRSQLWKKLSL